MKKILSLIIALGLVFALVGCNNTPEDISSQNSSTVSVETGSQEESNVESVSQPEETTPDEQSSESSQTTSSETAPIVNEKTITIPINVELQGLNVQKNDYQSGTYDVAAGDIILIDVNVNTENGFIFVRSTINFDSSVLCFVSCTNSNCTEQSAGKFLVTDTAQNDNTKNSTFRMKLKAVSSGTISINSHIEGVFARDLGALVKP